jgi:hypothetical protein
MRRKSLTDRAVKDLKPQAKRYAVPDSEMVGHYVRVAPSGAKAFVVVARNPSGKQVWSTIGAADVLSIAVRKLAEGVATAVRPSRMR